MTRLWRWRDSWYHYRHQVKLPLHLALYRTAYYEIMKREPWSR